MNTCSFFIKDKALFGSYPTQEKVNFLEESGVRYFIDLTYTKEPKITPYTTRYNYVNYPIHDKKIPKSWGRFAKLVRHVSNTIISLQDGELVYIHCKGGHGRSGVVVACVLCYIYKYDPNHALRLTNEYHNNRREMRDIWRQLGSPQNKLQQEFVRSFFRPLYFYSTNRNSLKIGLSNFSPHSVNVPDLGTFPTAESAYQAHKNPDDKTYISRQSLSHTPAISKILGRNCPLPSDWHLRKEEIIKKVIKLKFDQHPEIQLDLINTGLRPLIKQSKNPAWGSGINGQGNNTIGRWLMELRRSYQEKLDLI